MQSQNQLRFFCYVLVVTLLASLGCRSLSPQDGYYPVNPVATETPVYRNDKGIIIIDFTRLSDTLLLPVKVYYGLSLDSIHREDPIGIANDYAFLWTPEEADHQYFFTLVDKEGRSVTVAERLLYFSGTDNTRDLGGYRTSDGQTVRWGKLFRSGELSDLRKSDKGYWQNIGINKVIDFREPDARKRKPDRLPKNSSLSVRHLAVYDTGTTRQEYRRQLQRANPEVDNTEAILIENNKLYVEQYTDTFARAFQILIEHEQPLLYHCSAGKDRTGFMSAMILYTLGVPYETIMRDYMASNYYRSSHIRKRASLAPLIGINSYAALPLLEVRPIYLETAFQAVKEQYGSLDAYIRDGLGVSDSDRLRLKKKYLF